MTKGQILYLPRCDPMICIVGEYVDSTTIAVCINAIHRGRIRRFGDIAMRFIDDPSAQPETRSNPRLSAFFAIHSNHSLRSSTNAANRLVASTARRARQPIRLPACLAVRNRLRLGGECDG